MIIHFLSDSIYSKNFIEFVNSNFNIDEHYFIIHSSKKSNFVKFYESQTNCVISKSFIYLFLCFNKILKSNKIIVHQLNNIKLLIFVLLFYRNAFNKMLWVIWGGDLYFYKISKISLHNRIIEIIRKRFIKNLKFISSYIEGDYNLSKRVYKHNAIYLKSWYPGTIDYNVVEQYSLDTEKAKCIKVLVGNSADPNNNHLELFEMLSKFSEFSIHLFVILSYGGDPDYVKNVKSKGKYIFKDKITFIEDYMSKEDYFYFMKNIDICVFNHDRQQGLGNINLLLCIYKKVFIRSITTPYKYFTDKGIKIFKTDDIKHQTFTDFSHIDIHYLKENKNKMIEDLDLNLIYNYWVNIFYGNR